MKVSTRGRYALRFMIDLALHTDEQNLAQNVALKDISARQDISMKYLEQIVSKLCKSGMVYSYRGPQGGYRLVREPKDYTVGEILRTIEGKMAPVSCLVDPENLCARKDSCPTLKFWVGLEDVIDNYMDSVTLADLLDGCPNE